jgi:putative oxidoreductase
MESKRDQMTSFGLLILRLGVAGFLAYHGWGKLQMYLAGGDNIDKFADPLGIGPKYSLMGIIGAEFVCSLLVVIGFLTRLAALGPVFAMGVAAFKIHANDPLMMGGGAAKEPALLYLTVFLALFFTGAGRFSIDGMIFRRRTPQPL